MTTIWIDAQLSPAIAAWINGNFLAVKAFAVRDLSLRDAGDEEIFLAAKKADAVVITKDRDFVDLLDRLKAPPKIIWLTCGNTSNARLKEILTASLSDALEILAKGDDLIEIY
jgi:predicted nuclease of predicted toxin-antitoxin system